MLGIDTVLVLVGPAILLLPKPAKDAEKSFSCLSLLGSIVPVYKEVIAELKAAGASWIQLDEPKLVMDLAARKLNAFSDAFSRLKSTLSGLTVIVETYFAGLLAKAYKTLTSLKMCHRFWI
ncbi:hypothetical protein C5167_045680 [Papaver somniferum]|uniref:Cobalamin-independent methionine synthase MetE N-terminal domain-containing protein n=1 Tax=Papaver somniferum TaxID=3469 RepID=A0A4Y7LBL7_PAPSO|nr:hypothetical protein C5167_045680 [Papaver somniferum]